MKLVYEVCFLPSLSITVLFITFYFASPYHPYLSLPVLFCPRSAAFTFCHPMCPHVTLIYCFSPFVPLSFSMCLQSADSCLYFPNPPPWDLICYFSTFFPVLPLMTFIPAPVHLPSPLFGAERIRRSWLIGSMTL